MRTTIDLPDDLHQLARQIAHESDRSMSEVVTELIRLGLQPNAARTVAPVTGPRGLPTVQLGRPVTSADVRSLDDDE